MMRRQSVPLYERKTEALGGELKSGEKSEHREGLQPDHLVKTTFAFLRDSLGRATAVKRKGRTCTIGS